MSLVLGVVLTVWLGSAALWGCFLWILVTLDQTGRLVPLTLAVLLGSGLVIGLLWIWIVVLAP
jgi:hypothetical protein